MKRFLYIALILGAIALSAGTAQAATYYLSPTGSNSNPGTSNQPWLNEVPLNDGRFLSGDTAFFYNGTYNITNYIQIPDSTATYHNKTTVYAVANFNPNNIDSVHIWGPSNYSLDNVFAIWGRVDDHVLLYGLDCRYGARVVHINDSAHSGGGAQPRDITISHCRIRDAYLPSFNNPACIGSMAGTSNANKSRYLKIVGCKIGASTGPGSGHGSGILFYDASYSVVESCYFYGPFTGDAINQKNNNTYDAQAEYNVYRYNIIDLASRPAAGWGILLNNHAHYDSVYGNIIINAFNALGTNGSYTAGGQDASTNNCFLNNTTYNCFRGFYMANETGNLDSLYEFKYNVFYKSSRGDHSAGMDTVFLPRQKVNFNMYYDTNDSNVFVIGHGTNGATLMSKPNWLSSWHYDTSSVFNTNPGFTAPASLDFSRPSASGEMNLNYGGKHWSIYGAIQPDVDTTQTILTANTASVTISIPREQTVCSDTPGVVVAYLGYDGGAGGADSIFKVIDYGGSVDDILGIRRDFESGAHNYCSVIGDTMYLSIAPADNFFYMERVNMNTMTLISENTISSPSNGVYYAEVHNLNNSGSFIISAFRYQQTDIYYALSTNSGYTWGSWIAGPETDTDYRYGMPSFDTSVFVVNFDFAGHDVNVQYYNKGTAAWVDEGQILANGGTDQRVFSSIIVNDTIYVAQVRPSVVIVARKQLGSATIKIDTLFFSTNAFNSDNGAYMGYVSLSEIQSIGVPSIFYVHPDSGSTGISTSNLYFRYWQHNAWSKEYCVSNGNQAYNISSPYVIPTSHGPYAYCTVIDANGAHLTAVHINSVGGSGGGGGEEPPADTTAPVISSVSANPTTTGVTITWSTNESTAADSIYITGQTVASATTGTSHSGSKSGLTASTTYNYAIMSKDGSGNRAYSTGHSFTTDSESGGGGVGNGQGVLIKWK